MPKVMSILPIRDDIQNRSCVAWAAMDRKGRHVGAAGPTEELPGS